MFARFIQFGIALVLVGAAAADKKAAAHQSFLKPGAAVVAPALHQRAVIHDHVPSAAKGTSIQDSPFESAASIVVSWVHSEIPKSISLRFVTVVGLLGWILAIAAWGMVMTTSEPKAMEPAAVPKQLQIDLGEAIKEHGPTKKWSSNASEASVPSDDKADGSTVIDTDAKCASSRLDSSACDSEIDADSVTHMTGPCQWTPRMGYALMRDARQYYPYLTPVWLACVIFPLLMMKSMANPEWFLARVDSLPTWTMVMMFTMFVGQTTFTYAYNYFHYKDSATVPTMPEEAKHCEALYHVVVVPAYKEPIEVLMLTVESICEQTNIANRPLMVLGTEFRDPTRHECAKALREMCGNRVSGFKYTEHVLAEDETAGKHSNENFCVREVYKQLVEKEGRDPFEIMVTIVDADSLLSKTYLARVEHAFRAQRDGRRMIYNGPLNTYRNMGSSCFLGAFYEIYRCHRITFASPFEAPHPYSNYSLTLGLAHEIDYWTVDVIPEDIHIQNMAALNNLGSWSTVPVPAFICNDLVTDFRERYIQAKRHQWGITEVAWMYANYTKLPIPFTCFWSFAKNEYAREGSLFGAARVAVRVTIEITVMVCIALMVRDGSWQLFTTGKATVAVVLSAVAYLWTWVLFWSGELYLWKTALKQFEIESPGCFRFLIMIVFSPVLAPLCEFIFLVIPTIDCLLHCAIIGELAYVCAPKGANPQKSEVSAVANAKQGKPRPAA